MNSYENFKKTSENLKSQLISVNNAGNEINELSNEMNQEMDKLKTSVDFSSADFSSVYELYEKYDLDNIESFLTNVTSLKSSLDTLFDQTNENSLTNILWYNPSINSIMISIEKTKKNKKRKDRRAGNKKSNYQQIFDTIKTVKDATFSTSETDEKKATDIQTHLTSIRDEIKEEITKCENVYEQITETFNNVKNLKTVLKEMYDMNEIVKELISQEDLKENPSIVIDNLYKLSQRSNLILKEKVKNYKTFINSLKIKDLDYNTMTKNFNRLFALNSKDDEVRTALEIITGKLDRAIDAIHNKPTNAVIKMFNLIVFEQDDGAMVWKKEEIKRKLITAQLDLYILNNIKTTTSFYTGEKMQNFSRVEWDKQNEIKTRLTIKLLDNDHDELINAISTSNTANLISIVTNTAAKHLDDSMAIINNLVDNININFIGAGALGLFLVVYLLRQNNGVVGKTEVDVAKLLNEMQRQRQRQIPHVNQDQHDPFLQQQQGQPQGQLQGQQQGQQQQGSQHPQQAQLRQRQLQQAPLQQGGYYNKYKKYKNKYKKMCNN